MADQVTPGQRLAILAGFADALPDPCVLLDRRLVVVHRNGAAKAEFPALAAGSLLTVALRNPTLLDAIDAARLTGAAQTVELHQTVPNATWHRADVAPLPGEGELFAIVLRSLTEQKRLEQLRSDFIANASHELRTPLASVAGFIETLRGPARNDPAARDQFLQIMQSQTDRMARLIDDLLSLSRLEMKANLSPSDRIDIRPVIESTADALKPLAEENGVAIVAKLGGQPAIVAGARDELIQVFENLIENACKYGRSGGAVDVTLTQPGKQGGVDVTVRDHGPGIPEEHIPRLTERFYRVDVETSRGQKGTGLGLAIVKHILTRHNARLTIESRPGEGAAFTVHFPPVAS